MNVGVKFPVNEGSRPALQVSETALSTASITTSEGGGCAPLSRQVSAGVRAQASLSRGCGEWEGQGATRLKAGRDGCLTSIKFCYLFSKDASNRNWMGCWDNLSKRPITGKNSQIKFLCHNWGPFALQNC